MERMEIDDGSKSTGDSSSKTSEVETLWHVINTPVVGIFSELIKTGSEHGLKSFLESMTKSSDTLINILIPTYKRNGNFYTMQDQYTSFSTWLFGMLVNTLVMPLSPEIIDSSIEVQAIMLRILFRLYSFGFESIFNKYMTIFDKILNTKDQIDDNEIIIINSFHVDKEIEQLDLTVPPMNIESMNREPVLISIMKIILKSGVFYERKNILWNRLMECLSKSKPNAKLVAALVISEILKFSFVDDNKLESFFRSKSEIIKHSTYWMNYNLCNSSIIREMSTVLADILSNISFSMTSEIYDFFFLILEMSSEISNQPSTEEIITKQLQESICLKIVDYLEECPRFYSNDEIKKYAEYFQKLSDNQNFSRILAHLIIPDLKSSHHHSIESLLSKSKLWKELHDCVMLNLGSPEFINNFYNLTRIARSLSNWVSIRQLKLKFFEDINEIVNYLIKAIDISNIHETKIHKCLQCMINLLAIDNGNQMDIINILMIPWTSLKPCKLMSELTISNQSLSLLQAVDNDTKIKCIESISEFYRGKEKIKYLSACITGNQTELGIAVIQNTPLLLNDKEINFSDINTHILKPAMITQKIIFHEALSCVLGKIVCILSGKGIIEKEKFDLNEWYINCKYCNQELDDENHFIKAEEAMLLHPYYTLFRSKDFKVRNNLVKNLINFSNHIKEFNSTEILGLWLPLIRDPEEENREILAKSIEIVIRNRLNIENIPNKHLIMIDDDEWPNDLKLFIETIINILVDTLNEALEKSNSKIHKTLLLFATMMAKVPIHFIECRLCIVFIITIIHLNSTLTLAREATVAFKEISTYYGVTPKDLFVRYRKELMEVIIRMVARNFYEKSNNLEMSLHRVANCIGYMGAREFLRKNAHIAISILIPLVVKIPNLIDVLKSIASFIGLDLKDMLIDNFQHICPSVLINESPSIASECVLFISQTTNVPPSKLITNSFLEILRELLLHFHEKMSRVISSLDVISKFHHEYREYKFNTEKVVADFLQPHLHAILVYYDTNLSTISDEYSQRSAIVSLAALIEFMGADRLNQLKYKILATLRTLLKFTRPGFRKLTCYVWDAFLHNISLKELGPLLPTICVSLIPLLESYPDETNSMFEFIFIENNTQIAPYISELFFIDDLNVKPRILQIVKEQIHKSLPKEFHKNLELWQRRIIVETDEVKLKALIHLKSFLQQHRNELNEMILNDTNHVDPAIVKLLDSLLAGCQNADKDICRYCGECLGELGAIEPSLLPRRIISQADSKFISEMGREFICALLMELVRAFQMQSTTQNVDSFSLAIQEILRSYEISPTGRNQKLWNALSHETQQIVVPFLTSHYKILTTINPIDYPIYGTETGSTFDKWIFNWACRMIASIDDPKLSGILNACRPAFRRDIKTTIFCIPQLVAYSIMRQNKEDYEGLKKEILAVIKVVGNDKLDEDLTKRRPLRLVKDLNEQKCTTTITGATSNTNDQLPQVSDEDRRVRCCQVIFSTLDHLRRWLEEKRLEKNSNYRAIEAFLNELDNLVLAEGCYQSYEYHRALMYLERHMMLTKKGFSDSKEINLLAKIYTQLEEPDGVSGILSSQVESPTLEQLVLAHEVGGQLQDAATCYERLVHRKQDPKYIQGMIECYLSLEQPYTAINLVDGVLKNRPELDILLSEHEPFWQLAHFVNLDSKPTIKKLLADDLKRGIQPDLDDLKQKLVSTIGFAASHPDAYQQSYSQILKLHILNEFEKATEMLIKNKDNLINIFDEWEKRGRLVRASRGVEFVLGMRRGTLGLILQVETDKFLTDQNNKLSNHLKSSWYSHLKEEVGKIWLKSAKIARKSGRYQQAYMYILSSSDLCPPQELHIEKAQLYWQKGCQEDAFLTLNRSFTQCFKNSQYYIEQSSDLCSIERQNIAKAKLLFAKYNDEVVNVHTDINRKYYQEAVDVWRCWEKSYLACAQYHETLINRMSENEKNSGNGLCMQINIINNYGKSLQFGCKYIHQSMPRMLTIWMNFALKVVTNRSSSRAQVETFSKMSKIIGVYVDRLPNFMWLTAFSQLVSRICHPAKEIQLVLNKIFVNLIIAYPQYCLWMMTSVFNSSYPTRIKRCHDIFSNSRLDTSSLRSLIRDFQKLWERLIELSNKQVDKKTKNTTVSTLCKPLIRLLATANFGPIMIPTHLFLQLHLPRKSGWNHSIDQHNPFPTNWISIKSISEHVLILTSMQRPKRITFIGSDGNQYPFMCKSKDDLRIDFRLMEFNEIVNNYLQKDPESRQRRLYIRTYSVVPLNEECGLLEWVSNLVGFRQAIITLYKERGCYLTATDLMALLCEKKDSLERKRDVFLKLLLPKHPPVFGNWFRINFPDPYGWYEARNAYIRTTAVMSIVGYILGLGDRHGENILFDSKCGDCVHVDFNCLFNKGETFEWPERVPFRLTHNMIDAMGPLKYEGPFRKSCQITMRILREQTSTLMSILTPFVYDPLVSWSAQEQLSENAEMTNVKAVKNIRDIEMRLKGFVKFNDRGNATTTGAVSLSVEGQVNHLILEATNVDNLCQMYCGWNPFI
ncbi:serine/threonine-protein kinase ATR-like [Chelonus insularis]|uniref:serine/threonine-protein kinase ATR-like n=1 Tax=Chelonus insularis TaxID=460826 RepID=UPI001589F59C|nr:serine/threonine-protein kinase ATR-like [Chelonus insularis]